MLKRDKINTIRFIAQVNYKKRLLQHRWISMLIFLQPSICYAQLIQFVFCRSRRDFKHYARGLTLTLSRLPGWNAYLPLHQLKHWPVFKVGKCYTLLRYGKRLTFKPIKFRKERNTWDVSVPNGTQGFSSLRTSELNTIRELTDNEIKEYKL